MDHSFQAGATTGRRAWLDTPTVARAWLLIGTVVAVIAVLNAWTYSSAATGPLMQADAWYFLDVFVSKYLDGTLRFWDLFVQRGGSDHAQPLQKLILLFHTRYFDMDYRIEGLIGTAQGIAWCSVVALAVWTTQRRDRAIHVSTPIVLALVFVLGLSINSTNVFTWSLVTLIYVTLLVAMLYFLASIRLTESPHPVWLAPVALLQGLLIDEVAIIVFVASVIATGLFSPASRRNKLLAGAAGLGGLLVARLVLYLISSRGLEGSVAPPGALLDALVSTSAFRGAAVPFSDALIHVEHLQRFFPESTGSALFAVAAFVILLHIYFWGAAASAVRQGRRSTSLAIAVFLMLVSYALTAGIVVGRVPTFGWEYLHQPRYVIFYQTGLVAIAVMFVYRLGLVSNEATARRPLGGIESAGIIVITLLLIVAQLVVARQSWNLPRYLTPYWQNASLVMQRLLEDPSNVEQCPDILSVCEYPVERREHLMGLLAQHQLNVFSPAFQMRNRLYPSAQSVPALVSAEVGSNAEPDDVPSASLSGELGITMQAVPGVEGCDDTTGMPLSKVRFSSGTAHGMVQLWSDAPGYPRTLLAEHAGDEETVGIEARLPAGATLSLLDAGNQQVLARASFAPLNCEP